MRRIVVVGIGADGMAGLAPSARTELARATVVYGSPRQLDLLDHIGRCGPAAMAVADASCAADAASTTSPGTSMWWPAVIRCCTASVPP